jgi:hypothetical protein
MSPDLKSSLCLGAVARGLKFCTLGSGHCTFTTHTKKVDVVEGALYLSSGRNSAFSNHYLPTSVLTQNQLKMILQERHTKEEWVRLIHVWNSQVQEEAMTSKRPDTAFSRVGSIMVSTGVTPCRKRKSLYKASGSGDEETIPRLASSSSLSSPSASFDFDLVSIPTTESEGGEDRPQEVRINEMLD